MTLHDYYAAVRPFFGAEMALRTDVPEWLALARRLGARRILDLGCGAGRIAAALAADDGSRAVVGIDLLEVLLGRPPAIPFARADMRALPFVARFDLVVAANDPFAHLLDDADRERALREARRVLAPGGRAVIDGLFVAETGDFERSRDLGAGLSLTETWRSLGDGLYDTRFTYRRGSEIVTEAATRVRSWRADEPSVRACGAAVAGGLDGRRFDLATDRLVIVLGGAI